MKPFFKSLFDSETAFKRVLRALLVGLGGLLSSGSVPMLEPFKQYGPLLMGLGMVIPAGEMNEK